jgi:AAHS family benzoate transporter-like MFS transporter
MAEAVSAVATAESAREAKQVRTVIWVMSLALVGLLFDGYDLARIMHRGLAGVV